MNEANDYNLHEVTENEFIKKLEKYLKLKKIYLKKPERCIGCKRNVSSIFKKENKVYIAKCGDLIEPCPLDIRLKEGIITLMPHIFHDSKQMLQETEEDILKLKMNYVFNIISEPEMLQEFQTLKQKYTTQLKLLKEYEQMLQNDRISKNNIRKTRIEVMKRSFYSFPSNNANEEQQLGDNIEDIDIQSNYDNYHQLHNMIQTQQNLIREQMTLYMRFKDIDTVKNVVQLYIQNVIPIIQRLKKEYKEFQIGYDILDESEYRVLFKSKHNIKSKEYEHTPNQVISFVIR